MITAYKGAMVLPVWTLVYPSGDSADASLAGGLRIEYPRLEAFLLFQFGGGPSSQDSIQGAPNVPSVGDVHC